MTGFAASGSLFFVGSSQLGYQCDENPSAPFIRHFFKNMSIAVVRAFVPTMPGSLWSELALTQVRALPKGLSFVLVSHHLMPMVGSIWEDLGEAFLGSTVDNFINVVFDDRDKQSFTPPKMLGVAGAGEDAPWLEEVSKPPLIRFWTANVYNVLVTRPQGRKLSVEERDYLLKYEAVVTDREEWAATMEQVIGRKVFGNLNVALDAALLNAHVRTIHP